MKSTIGVVSLLASSIALASPSNDELQKQINELRAQLDATANAVETNAGSASSVSIGGYGELHYNNFEDKDNQIDFHRFVLFVGKELNSTTRFFSEFEIEHALAGNGKPGEVEIEQAFIEKDINDSLSAKAGLFLVPVGILNETHEPDTFYGVERNNVEKNIIPTTWWEGGAALTVKGEKVSYDVALHSGLNIDTAGSLVPRKGRQKVAEAVANDLAITARATFKPTAGVSVGATFQYQEDVTQGTASVEGHLIETHAVVEQGDFGLRALYAQWTFDDKVASIVDGAEKQSGYYIEPAYKVSKDLGVFARYSSYENLAGNSADSAVNETTIGANYWLADTVVLKVDFNQADDTAANETSNSFNLGVGYSF